MVTAHRPGSSADGAAATASDRDDRMFPKLFLLGTYHRHGKSWPRTLLKWGTPFFLNVLLNFVCAWLLHVGTFLYINQMVEFESAFKLRGDADPDPDSVPFSFGTDKRGESYGSLNDPLEQAMGFQKVSLATLDLVAACFPLAFVVLAVLMDDLRSWTKVMLCHGLLAIGKGLFSVMSVVPDSQGWQGCKDRIGEEGVAFLSNPDTWDHMLWKMFILELFGYKGKRLRWCADMMWSGHTYATTLYALGLYELTRDLFRRDGEGGKPAYKRYAALAIVTAITVGEQSIEVYFVIINRFHYTMDVVMAIMLTFLFYTNGVIAVFAKEWIGKWQIQSDQALAVDTKEVLMKVRLKNLVADADVFIPPCCIPFSMSLTSKHLIYGENDIEDMLTENVNNPPRQEELTAFGTVDKLMKYRDKLRTENRMIVPGDLDELTKQVKEEGQRLIDRAEDARQKAGHELRQEGQRLLDHAEEGRRLLSTPSS